MHAGLGARASRDGQARNEIRYSSLTPVPPHSTRSRGQVVHETSSRSRSPSRVSGSLPGERIQHPAAGSGIRAGGLGMPHTGTTPAPRSPKYKDTALGKSLTDYHANALQRRIRLDVTRRRLMSTPPADTAEGREYRRITHMRQWSNDARRDRRRETDGREHDKLPGVEPPVAKKHAKTRMTTVADKQARKLGIRFPSSMESMPTSELNEWVPPPTTTQKGRMVTVSRDALYYQRQREASRRRSSRKDLVRQQRKVTREIVSHASVQLHSVRERTDTWDGRMPNEHGAGGYGNARR
ncbi:hypothetical protein BJ508DRAFT_311790 [Ascobolus immersus RN42]|uniref:Uncharacterized protein n=1 Tax=Ascobolus immersus RN42 TaxID=1160509 RepID=A0A3N4HPP7_ASCIM|nr:hypothetical protein BJ508DRAFT_311790 [Ascobolus immersus RN42]